LRQDVTWGRRGIRRRQRLRRWQAPQRRSAGLGRTRTGRPPFSRGRRRRSASRRRNAGRRPLARRLPGRGIANFGAADL